MQMFVCVWSVLDVISANRLGIYSVIMKWRSRMRRSQESGSDPVEVDNRRAAKNFPQTDPDPVRTSLLYFTAFCQPA